METIALHCRRAIMFWMCHGAVTVTFARNRNRSQLSRTRLSTSIWISTRAFVECSPLSVFGIRFKCDCPATSAKDAGAIDQWAGCSSIVTDNFFRASHSLGRRAVPKLQHFSQILHSEIINIRIMAGHSKWSKVKRFKGAIDAKRGKIFSKLSKEITIAAKTGGGDPNGNLRLRSAIQAARGQSMPNDNIERAIRRGTGEGSETQHFDEIVYEGYGPGGVAVIVEAATDNKNRTAAEVRSIFSKNDGNLASTGSVSYMFHKKGQITVPRSSINEDDDVQNVYSNLEIPDELLARLPA